MPTGLRAAAVGTPDAVALLRTPRRHPRPARHPLGATRRPMVALRAHPMVALRARPMVALRARRARRIAQKALLGERA